ncbi:hypothetical protein OYT1_ch2665 [Ferriphaselus amnicola]|uniref:Integrase n=1 Tax=Ferriphaselus amnicola TaxID=1188319 RepID=A0A2Z6GFJ9_9PROT|nr:hypothetical protein [Ferriphaselus amnicola]BBE52172.1 hypothetical protein OYT1_ch2665 [Ferriphaselus amnicola]
MKIEARIYLNGVTKGPDPWDENKGIYLPLDHIICRDVDGTPHTVGEFVWPWTAYTAHQKRFLLHFYYWKQKANKINANMMDITVEREARMRELQFLMTRQIYYGNESAPNTLKNKLAVLRKLARFSESQGCAVRDVLTQTALLDAFGASLPNQIMADWITWITFLRQLDPQMQLGFTLATPKCWKEVERRAKEYRDNVHQFAPLPTRIYAALINNLSAELDDIEVHKSRLMAALREAFDLYHHAKATETEHGLRIGGALIKKHNLGAYLERRGYGSNQLRSIGGALREIFQVCKLQIHVFSGMRDTEARHLPFHCMASEESNHGRKHCLIIGSTTKFNKGRRLRTKWVTTERDGFRAIRLAQEFAAMYYKVLGVTPSKADDIKDNYPLFPSTAYLPWMMGQPVLPGVRISACGTKLSHTDAMDSMLSRLCATIDEQDIAELEDIDPFRAWHEESEFMVGQRWPLTTHQLRRSLAVYANASGLVRLSSLRRQLQHMTREMALYYGRGSTFCKNFIADDPAGFKKHIAVDWQDGAEEAEMLAFVRDVLNSAEPMFGGAGNFYERQRERGEVMSREEVGKQMKAGLLAYRDGPLGGCTRPGMCETRKGLNLIDTVCATNGCKHLIGKHSKIVQTIRLKRAAIAHITPGSITEVMEREELETLERVEREWRLQEHPAAHSTGDGNA